jgi:hypothetical protein
MCYGKSILEGFFNVIMKFLTNVSIRNILSLYYHSKYQKIPVLVLPLKMIPNINKIFER